MIRRLFQSVAVAIVCKACERAPDFVIGPEGDVYLRRWWLIPRNRLFNVYLHEFLRSDDDRALHDHPWWNVSLLLAGEYVEHTIDAGGVHRRVRYRAGQVKFRRATAAHRIELIDFQPVWSLFLTGPVVRAWGFHCLDGWKHHRAFGRDGGCGDGVHSDFGARQ